MTNPRGKFPLGFFFAQLAITLRKQICLQRFVNDLLSPDNVQVSPNFALPKKIFSQRYDALVGLENIALGRLSSLLNFQNNSFVTLIQAIN